MWINVFLMKREREKKEKSDFKYTETDAPPPRPLPLRKKIGEGAPSPIFSEGRRRLYIGQLFIVDLQ